MQVKNIEQQIPEETIPRKNSILYFYIYFVAQLIFVFVNSYLPIYYFKYLAVDKTQLAFVQVISYSALFAKPLISLYFDRDESRLSKTRQLMILSAIGIFGSFLSIILSLEILLLFGILLGVNFAFTAIIDVSVDKMLVETSITEKQKSRNTLFLQMGSVLGAIIVPGLYMVVPSWSVFFVSGAVLVFPLIFIMYFKSESVERNPSEETEQKPAFEPNSVRNIALLCGVAFLLYADQIYQWPLEPFVVSFIGEDLFSLLLIGFILINGLGILIAGMISHNYDKKKLLLYNIIIVGMMLIFAPFVNIWVFLGLYAVLQILAGFLIVNLISLMIDVSKKQVLIFQIIAAFIALAKLVLVPIGTFLSGIIDTQWIIFIAGVLFLFSVIPLMGVHAE
ncbi:MAG: hypothetical protein GF311_14795 [Candidatus Lokiarchaeota archaeon]|nr:hypothetical protein [Candidatus Lokiarchaeota archaeon]